MKTTECPSDSTANLFVNLIVIVKEHIVHDAAYMMLLTNLLFESLYLGFYH